MKRVALIALSVLACAAPARGEPRWQPPVLIAPPADIYTGLAYDDPILAVNARGDAAIGFSLFIGTTPVAEVAWRRAGARDWSGPARLAEGSWQSPRVALDAAGNGLAAFDKGLVQTSYHPVGAVTWGDAITIGGNPLYVATPGFDAFGNATAAWNVWRDPDDIVQTATRAADGRWQQPPTDVSPPTDRIFGPASLAVDARGDALLAWSYSDAGDRNNVRAVFRPRGSSAWGDAVDVAANWGAPYDWPVFVALDDAGGATVAWGYQSGGVNAAYRPFGGRWEPLQVLSHVGQPEGLAVGPDGQAVVLFAVRDRGAVFATSRVKAGTPWSVPVQLSDSSRDARRPSLASDAQGNVIATWIEQSRGSGSEILRAALRPVASRQWEPPLDVVTKGAGSFGSSVVAMDGSGNAFAVWDPYVFQYRRGIEVAELRAGGPILSQLSTPTVGGTGVGTRFSVRPLPWGAPLVAATKWDFGDGSSATGTDVSHSYAHEGTYTVTVSAFAANGASTDTRTITVGRPTLANVRRPRIQGLARVGHLVGCDRGEWAGTEPIVYTTSWLRNGSAIARGARYRIGRADAGALLACRVRATNGPKTAAAVSPGVRVRR